MTNFKNVEIGTMAELGQNYENGKAFLHDLLGLTSCEISVSSMPAGVKLPFNHKHIQNEEIYIFLKGEGTMTLDNEIIEVNITWDNNKRNYEPDFVVETADSIYLVETKKESDISTDDVQQKAKAALEYCHNATEFTTKNNGKPWKYLLLPHNSVSINYDFNYYTKQYEYKE